MYSPRSRCCNLKILSKKKMKQLQNDFDSVHGWFCDRVWHKDRRCARTIGRSSSSYFSARVPLPMAIEWSFLVFHLEAA
jgi:hypothetical protein